MISGGRTLNILSPEGKNTPAFGEASRNSGSWVADHPEAPVWVHIAVNLGVVFLSIVLAWSLLKIYDEPVREWLKEHWLKGKKRLSQR